MIMYPGSPVRDDCPNKIGVSLGLGTTEQRELPQKWCKGTENGQIQRFLVCLSTHVPSKATVIRYKLKELIAQKSFVEDRRVTLDEVAEVTGISRNTLSRIVNTRGYSTTTDAIDKLCDYFDCEISEVMERVVLDDCRKSK